VGDGIEPRPCRVTSVCRSRHRTASNTVATCNTTSYMTSPDSHDFAGRTNSPSPGDRSANGSHPFLKSIPGQRNHLDFRFEPQPRRGRLPVEDAFEVICRFFVFTSQTRNPLQLPSVDKQQSLLEQRHGRPPIGHRAEGAAPAQTVDERKSPVARNSVCQRGCPEFRSTPRVEQVLVPDRAFELS